MTRGWGAAFGIFWADFFLGFSKCFLGGSRVLVGFSRDFRGIGVVLNLVKLRELCIFLQQSDHI